MKNLVLFTMGFQGVFCAIDGSVPEALLRESIGAHKVKVLFKPVGEELLCLYWDTYGIVDDRGLAADAVLERHLVNARSGQIIDGSEIGNLLSEGFFSLRACLREKTNVSFNTQEGHCLQLEHLDKMFPHGAPKTWRVLSAGCAEPCVDGEVKVLFDAGGYSCKPSVKWGKRLTPGARLMDDVQQPFVKKLRSSARTLLHALEGATRGADAKIIVRKVDNKFSMSGVEWDGKDVEDSSGRSIGSFLRDCILLGTSLGYTNEDAIRYYAFTNKSLVYGVLRKFLRFDLLCNNRVKPLDDVPLMSPFDLRKLHFYGWGVSPQGELQRPQNRETLSITFGGFTLEGVSMKGLSVMSWFEGIYPHNFLWGLESSQLIKAKTFGTSWYEYGAHAKSQRLLLGGLGKAALQYKSLQGYRYQAFWDIREVGFGEKSAEEVFEVCFQSALSEVGFRVDGSSVCAMLKQELPKCLERKIGVTYDMSKGKPLHAAQVVEMFSGDAGHQWSALLLGCEASCFLPGELRVFFSVGGLQCVPKVKACAQQLSPRRFKRARKN